MKLYIVNMIFSLSLSLSVLLNPGEMPLSGVTCSGLTSLRKVQGCQVFLSSLKMLPYGKGSL